MRLAACWWRPLLLQVPRPHPPQPPCSAPWLDAQRKVTTPLGITAECGGTLDSQSVWCLSRVQLCTPPVSLKVTEVVLGTWRSLLLAEISASSPAGPDDGDLLAVYERVTWTSAPVLLVTRPGTCASGAQRRDLTCECLKKALLWITVSACCG